VNSPIYIRAVYNWWNMR